MSEPGPIHYLTLEDVLHIRDTLAAQYQDSFDVLRFHQLLSALASPQQSLFGEEIFPTLCAKAGMLLTGLVRNHPFWDGNKRTALLAMIEFLARNGRRFVAADDDGLYDWVLSAAARTTTRAEQADWVAARSEVIV